MKVSYIARWAIVFSQSATAYLTTSLGPGETTLATQVVVSASFTSLRSTKSASATFKFQPK